MGNKITTFYVPEYLLYYIAVEKTLFKIYM